MADERPEFVYFILDDRGDPMLLKIGRSVNPDRRDRQLQTGNGYKFRFLGCVPGGAAEEKKMHDAFNPWRAEGEWFAVGWEAVELIEAICAESERRILTDQLERSTAPLKT